MGAIIAGGFRKKGGHEPATHQKPEARAPVFSKATTPSSSRRHFWLMMPGAVKKATHGGNCKQGSLKEEPIKKTNTCLDLDQTKLGMESITRNRDSEQCRDGWCVKQRFI